MTEHAELLAELQSIIRREERQRAARIVWEFEVYSPYIVQKHNISERKRKLVELIMDGMDHGIQGPSESSSEKA